jgi:hypothetical protein
MRGRLRVLQAGAISVFRNGMFTLQKTRFWARWNVCLNYSRNNWRRGAGDKQPLQFPLQWGSTSKSGGVVSD